MLGCVFWVDVYVVLIVVEEIEVPFGVKPYLDTWTRLPTILRTLLFGEDRVDTGIAVIADDRNSIIIFCVRICLWRAFAFRAFRLEVAVVACQVRSWATAGYGSICRCSQC